VKGQWECLVAAAAPPRSNTKLSRHTEVRLGRWLEVPDLNLTSTVSLSRHQSGIMHSCLFYLVNGNTHSLWTFALKIRREFASIVPATQFLQSCTRVCEKSMTGGRESIDTTYRPRALQQQASRLPHMCSEGVDGPSHACLTFHTFLPSFATKMAYSLATGMMTSPSHVSSMDVAIKFITRAGQSASC
jgi:hypothetical protein